jgi:hypothetical protein
MSGRADPCREDKVRPGLAQPAGVDGYLRPDLRALQTRTDTRAGVGYWAGKVQRPRSVGDASGPYGARGSVSDARKPVLDAGKRVANLVGPGDERLLDLTVHELVVGARL